MYALLLHDAKNILCFNLFTCKVLLWRHAQVEKLSAVIRKAIFQRRHLYRLYRTLLYLMPSCDTSMTRPMLMMMMIRVIIIISFVAFLNKTFVFIKILFYFSNLNQMVAYWIVYRVCNLTYLWYIKWRYDYTIIWFKPMTFFISHCHIEYRIYWTLIIS